MKRARLFVIVVVLMLIPVIPAAVFADWNGSSLDNPGIACGSDYVAGSIQNVGTGPKEVETPWELRYSPMGNPKNGEVVAHGLVPALAVSQTYEFTTSVSAVGQYAFLFYQEEGHPGTGEVWSEAVTAPCGTAVGPTIEFKGCSLLYVRWEDIPSPLDMLLPYLSGWAKVARPKNGGVEGFWLDPDARNNGRLSVWRGHFAYVGPGLYSVRYAALGGNLYIINEHPEEQLSCRARIHLPGMNR